MIALALALLAQADPHAGHAMPQAAGPAIGNAPAPAPPTDHAADRDYDPAAMEAARARLRREHGGGTWSLVSIPIAEYQARKGADGYRWNGEASYGSDLHRLVVKTEGEGDFGAPLDEGEVRALYSHPLDPYWNVQAGLRRDFGQGPDRSWLAAEIEGLAPYWFELEGSLYLSTRGDLTGEAQASYDLRVTGQVTLQPRLDLNFAAQDIPEKNSGSGLVDGAFDLRLKYQVRQEFQPYVGVSFERSFGDTRRFARAAGAAAHSTAFVAGVSLIF